MLDTFASQLNDSWLGETIRSTGWMYPTFESIHVIAITIVVGMISIMDLRLLGLPSNGRPVSELARETLHWVWAAFVVAVITGALMTVSQAQVFLSNPWYLLKMGLILLAGINMLYFELITSRTMGQWNIDVAPAPAARMAAAISLTLWVGVVVLGRVMGFTLNMLAGSDLTQYLSSM